jgi:hypothetical protein
MTDERWAVDASLDEGSNYLSMMYAAYQRETNIPAEEVALVETKLPDGTVVTYFATREQVMAFFEECED